MFEAALLGSIGGVYIAIISIVVFSLMTWTYEYESFFATTLIAFTAFLLFQFGFGIPVLSTILYNPWILFVGTVLYIGIGSLYAVYWKMPDFVKRHARSIQSDYKQWKRNEARKKEIFSPKKSLSDYFDEDEKQNSNKETAAVEDTDEMYSEFLKSGYYQHSAASNKNRIFGWIFYWPFGMVWELIHKPVKWTWNATYSFISSSLEAINNKTAKNILKNSKK